MDYLDFYSLEFEPFSSAPISRFYFNSAQHSRAMVRLMYAIDTMKGLAVCIGDVGTGKTTLARRMLDNLPEEEYESALLVIIHSNITAEWLLNRIARQLGVEEPAPEKLKLLNQLFSRLMELHEQGKKAVVLIDEAQMLRTKEIMEEFRGMLNLEMPESKLITFVFFGLTELEDYLHLDEPLAQRVAVKCTLESFNIESTEGYINHRLRLAGASSELFSKEAISRIHFHSRGVPRLINTICDNCLFEGYLLKKKLIEEEVVDSLASDLGLIIQPRAVAQRPVPKKTPTKVVPAALPTKIPASAGPPPFEAAPPQNAPYAIPQTVRQPAPRAQTETYAESTETELEAAMESAGLFEEEQAEEAADQTAAKGQAAAAQKAQESSDELDAILDSLEEK